MARRGGKNEVLLEFAGDADKLEREARRTVRAVDDVGDKVSRTARQIDRDTDRMGTSFGKFKDKALVAGAAIGAGLAVGIGAALAGAKSAIDSFLEAETAGFRQRFALEQAGLGEFVEELQEFNSELAKVAPFDDDAFAGAQGILARAFGTPEELRRYTRLTADIAAVSGKSLDTVAAGLVKFKSTGSGRIFSEFGIDLRGAGDEVLSAADAFAILESKVGGAAEELGREAPGQIDILKNALGDVAEVVGEKLTPGFIGMLDKALEWAEGALGAAEDVGGAFGDLDLETGNLEESLGGLEDQIKQGLNNALEDLKGWLSDNKDEIQDFIDDAAYIIDHVGPVLKFVIEEQTGIWKALAIAIGATVDGLAWYINLVKSNPWLSPLAATFLNAPAPSNVSQKAQRLSKKHAGTGGMVPGAPGEEVPALLLAGEKVVPRGGSGNSVVLQVTANDSETAEFIAALLRRYVKASGGNVQVALGF